MRHADTTLLIEIDVMPAEREHFTTDGELMRRVRERSARAITDKQRAQVAHGRHLSDEHRAQTQRGLVARVLAKYRVRL